MNRVDYSKPKVIKSVLYRYDELMRMAKKGDQISAIVCIDVKRAIHARGVLTFKQRRYLSLWWQGFNTIEIATMYNVSHVGVVNMIKRAFSRLSKYLCKKVTKSPLSVAKYRGVKNGR